MPTGLEVPVDVEVTVTSLDQGAPAVLSNAWPAELTDGTHGPAAVKAASTAPLAADPALVVALSPNSAPPAPAPNFASQTVMAGGTGAIDNSLTVPSTGLYLVSVALAAVYVNAGAAATSANAEMGVGIYGPWKLTAGVVIHALAVAGTGGFAIVAAPLG